MKPKRTLWLDLEAFKPDKKWLMVKEEQTNDIILKEPLKELSDFFKWVESTSLFMAIKSHSGNPEWTINAVTNDDFLSINLSNKKINLATELPKEVLYQFYINSPWYKEAQDDQHKLSNELNKLLNENTNTVTG